MIKEIIEKEAPHVSISISYHVLPQIREYERTSTTVTNAYVKPLTGSYLARLSGSWSPSLRGQAVHHALAAESRPWIRRPVSVRIIESGPTAAVIAGQYYGRCSTFRTCSVLTWVAPQPSPA